MKFDVKHIIVALMVGTLTSCEVIPEGQQLIPVDMAETNRTTLLVDFSALKCVNCPNAAEEAHNLQALYGDKLIVVEMHPASNPLTQAKAEWDYTCDAADAYYLFFGGNSTTPLPTGVINMAKTDDTYFVDYSKWGACYANSAKAYSPVRMTQQAIYNPQTRETKIQLSVANIMSESIDNLQYIAWVTEDSIVGPQAMPDGSNNMSYTRNHVLRDAITDIWGQALSLAQAETKTVELTYTLSEKYVAENCNVVGIIMQDGVVIQAHQVKIHH